MSGLHAKSMPIAAVKPFFTEQREWKPRSRSQPTVCIFSIYTDNLLQASSWGHSVALQNANYCMAHGYTFSLFIVPPASSRVSIMWLKPRAAVLVARQGAAECSWLLAPPRW